MNILLAWGPAGVFLLAAIDSAGVPIPSGVDALLVFLASRQGPAVYWLAAWAVLGSTLGNMVLFYLARKGGEVYLERRTQSARTRRFRAWFQQYGLLTVFIPAVLPIPLPMKVFVLSAGALGVSPLGFLAVVLVARAVRYGALTYLGIQLGEHSLKYLRDHAWELAAVAAGLFLVLYLLVRFHERFRKTRMIHGEDLAS